MNLIKQAQAEYEDSIVKVANAYGFDPHALYEELEKEAASQSDLLKDLQEKGHIPQGQGPVQSAKSGVTNRARQAKGLVGSLGEKATGLYESAADKMPGGGKGLAAAGALGAAGLGLGAHKYRQGQKDQEKEAAVEALLKVANVHGFDPYELDEALTKVASDINRQHAMQQYARDLAGTAEAKQKAQDHIRARQIDSYRNLMGGGSEDSAGLLGGLRERAGGLYDTAKDKMPGGGKGLAAAGALGAGAAGLGARQLMKSRQQEDQEKAAAVEKLAHAHGVDPNELYYALEKEAADRAQGQAKAHRESIDPRNNPLTAAGLAGAGGLGLGLGMGHLGNLGGVQNQTGLMGNAAQRLRGLAGGAFGHLQQAQQTLPGSGLQQGLAAGALGAGALGAKHLMNRDQQQDEQQKEAAAENLGISREELDYLIEVGQQ